VSLAKLKLMKEVRAKEYLFSGASRVGALRRGCQGTSPESPRPFKAVDCQLTENNTMASKFYIGQRLSYDSVPCTVRYIGPVAGTQNDWLGVEWDYPSRGKHDGAHKGVRYFTSELYMSVYVKSIY